MGTNAFAIIGSGAIGTSLSQLIPNALLIGRNALPPLFCGKHISPYCCRPESVSSAFTVIFCVKSYDVPAALKQYRKFLNENQNIIVICNGFYHHLFARRYLGDFKNVWAGFTTIAASCVNRNVKMNYQGMINLSSVSDSVQMLPRLMNISVTLENFSKISWEKGVMNSLINVLGTIYKIPNGMILSSAEIFTRLNKIFQELENLSDVLSLPCPSFDRVENLISDTAENHCSTLQDLLAGKKSELPYITGYILKQAVRSGIMMPELKKAYQEAETLFERS